MIRKLIIVPDSHCEVGISNERYSLLGRLVAEEQPDVICCLGDWADMPSLSLFDVGKKSFEGRRYRKDIEHSWDAMEKFFDPIKKLNDKLRLAKTKKYRPALHMLYGNHEHRISRAIESDPKIEGTISLEDLNYEEYGWKTTPYKEILHLEGIAFTHHFTKGLMDRPLGGANIGRDILKTYHSSGFMGHTHLLSLYNEANSKGETMWGGSLGCLFEHNVTYVSKAAQSQWWRGVTIMEGVRDGVIEDLRFTTLKKMQRDYR
jgi:hypothetical protein